MIAFARTLLLAMAFTQSAHAAESTAAGLAEMMRQARISEGFEVRMNVSVTRPDGTRVRPFRVAVIGQIDAHRQRLLIRGIAPETVKDRAFVAERAADGGIRVVGFDATGGGGGERDPHARLYNSGLILWDMFAPWWGWKKLRLGESGTGGGLACRVVRAAAEGEPVAAVESCVNPEGGLAVKTQLFDAHHNLLRTLNVAKPMRKASGKLAAKRLNIVEADGTLTEIEVYAGDENYQITSDTFERLNARTDETLRR